MWVNYCRIVFEYFKLKFWSASLTLKSECTRKTVTGALKNLEIFSLRRYSFMEILTIIDKRWNGRVLEVAFSTIHGLMIEKFSTCEGGSTSLRLSLIKMSFFACVG